MRVGGLSLEATYQSIISFPVVGARQSFCISACGPGAATRFQMEISFLSHIIQLTLFLLNIQEYKSNSGFRPCHRLLDASGLLRFDICSCPDSKDQKAMRHTKEVDMHPKVL